jgi:hypothetical protein|tara:strand:- start:6 stop:512 length:507 start_codon:yes stop_codon:yes gene_type:complete
MISGFHNYTLAETLDTHNNQTDRVVLIIEPIIETSKNELMRIVKNTLFAFAVSMTAIFNLASAQNQQVVFNQNTFEITYTSDVPKYISFMLFGDESLGVGLYGQVSNVSNQDGTCTATYDLDKLLSCGAGEKFAKAYSTCDAIEVFGGKLYDAPVLFYAEEGDFIRNN